MLEDTIVVEFSGGSETDYIAVIDFDDALNLDSNGDPIRTFAPGDDIHIWLHVSSNVIVDDVAVTSGSISDSGTDVRSDTQRVLFSSRDTSDPTQVVLPVVPISFNNTYYGKPGSPSINSDALGVITLSANDVMNVPYIGDIDYSFPVYLFTIKAPEPDLGVDDSFPIAVVFYLRER